MIQITIAMGKINRASTGKAARLQPMSTARFQRGEGADSEVNEGSADGRKDIVRFWWQDLGTAEPQLLRATLSIWHTRKDAILGTDVTAK